MEGSYHKVLMAEPGAWVSCCPCTLSDQPGWMPHFSRCPQGKPGKPGIASHLYHQKFSVTFLLGTDVFWSKEFYTQKLENLGSSPAAPCYMAQGWPGLHTVFSSLLTC